MAPKDEAVSANSIILRFGPLVPALQCRANLAKSSLDLQNYMYMLHKSTLRSMSQLV